MQDLLSSLLSRRELSECVTLHKTIPQKKAVEVDFPAELGEKITRALQSRGIHKLYSHQYETFRTVKEGKNVVVVTPTASGKTLCYNLPVMSRLLSSQDARALYLFPTKALSQDQQAELNETVLGADLGLKVFTYDGDTPSSIRVAARDSGRIVISNPDMLHAGILPNHPKWIKFLASLQFVVIDEIHIYRGVFGSHMANLIRRLKRILAFYGAHPVFICCSATIGNPDHLAETLIGEPVTLVNNNGAPSGIKHLVLYNPPLVDPVQGIRRGVVTESVRIAKEFLLNGVKTIVFARSRVRTELIGSYINRDLANRYSDNRHIRVETYRGGYLPRERRMIEQGLRNGSIQGVVSTNALELGIDIGGLDAAVLAGFPGSIASLWQQAGRAGRRSDESAAFMIASSAPTDQYLVKHPEYLLGESPESAWVDPDNPYILSDHIKCAVFEIPFKDSETFGPAAGEMLRILEEEGVVRLSGGTWYWADRSYPAEQISLRSSSPENVVIIDITGGRQEVIGEMDVPSAKELLHEGAVYLHRQDQFLVTELDLEHHTCRVTGKDVNFYTDTIVKTDIKVLHEDHRELTAGAGVLLGDVLVRTQVTKYKKLKFRTHENLGYGDVFLPPEEVHTRSLALIFQEETPIHKAFYEAPEYIREQLIGRLGNLLIQVAPVFLLCDSRDLGTAERLKDPHTGYPTIYIYDRAPGGSGLSEGFARRLEVIRDAAAALVTSCPCEGGCPSCIGPEDEKAAVGNIKEAVIRFFDHWK
ncbi:MAG: DEAD/DEAH box helicase [Spirochaetales bacterium]|nr:DEAD/DEAH box helicase [Spirochaetales bacterium]